MNYAYVTLLSSKDYVPPVLILNQNLKDLKCKYPLLVMVTADIIKDVFPFLSKAHVEFEVIDRLYYTQKTIDMFDPISTAVKNTAPKIQLFNLHKYDKLVYIDADSVFVNNPDWLFDKPDGAMYDDSDDELGFSGLFVCCPKMHPFDYYKCLLENKDILDGDLLGNLWFPFRTNPDYRIDTSWFINIVLLKDDISLDKINGIHFCNKYKPWNYNDPYKYIDDLTQTFPQDGNNNRLHVSAFYIKKYLIPLKKKYNF